MLQAVNNFIFILRDEADREKDGLILPSSAQEKPSKGRIVSAGDKVADKYIRNGKGKECLFMKGSGWEMEVHGVTYLVIEDSRVVCIL
jgi:chaperonin GroES